ncbi:MAG: hypothetical protein HZB56_00710 [Deltaproteobacteria bacterium]|nr:hypothetical protein [Deltaproteobacteria bacterium]
MLDAFVIEEIKRREQERHREERPSLELPVPPPPPAHSDDPDGHEPPGSGVVIIDYTD